ncbi:hypothetical protein HBI69_134440 [Parastagonospora nodorum]|nr:hypothetical protein HBI69_134440 [Parastagonospora nodorum]
MDCFCTICSFQPKTYAGLAKHIARCYSRHLAQQSLELSKNVHVCAADGLSSTMIVYDHIEKDKNADLAIADSISDAPDMCAKDNLEVLFQTHDGQLAGELATAESVTAKDSNHVDTFGSDFAFSFASGIQDNIWIQEDIAKTSGLSGLKADQHFFVYQNILSLIAFIISYCLFADKLNIQQSLPDRAIVVLIIISRSIPSTLLARFIPTTKICDPLLKSQVYYYCMGKLLLPLENAAKSGILLACADRRTRQCYPTILLLTSIKKNRHCTRYTVAPDDREDLSTDTLHLLLKGLVMKMLDFMQDILDDIYPSKQKAIIQQLIAVVSLLFVSKAPFALHFIRAVCDLVTLAQYKSHDEDTLAYIQGALERMNVFKEEFRVYRRTLGEEKNFNYPKALDSICTGANSEAHHITIVKQFYSMTNKKEYILQICLHNSQRTALLAADYATILIPGIQPYLTKLPLSEVAVNIAISDFTHAAAVSCMSVQIHPSIKCWRSSSKRHNDPKHCNEEVLHLILIIIDHTCYDKDRKHMAYIRAFSEVLLFNNNGQIDNTTRMLSVRRRAWNAAPKRRTLQAFKFYDLSTIIRPVHLDEYNRLYSPTFNIDLLRTLREYRRKRTRNN